MHAKCIHSRARNLTTADEQGHAPTKYTGPQILDVHTDRVTVYTGAHEPETHGNALLQPLLS